MTEFARTRVPPAPGDTAPDGTDVRALLALPGGSVAHFELAPGLVSQAVAHHTVEEIWYFLSGRGEMWRRHGAREEIVTVENGVCITIPSGTQFQFRCFGHEALAMVVVTMPPWPGPCEAYRVEGAWISTVTDIRPARESLAPPRHVHPSIN